jgi:hypothetical protein
MRAKRSPAVDMLAADIRKTLGLDPQADHYQVVYGAVPANDREIAVLTRSVLEVLVDIATDIEVPAADVRENRVSPTFEETLAGENIPPLIRIRSSAERPAEAFASVFYQGSHFWIDDRDLRSKRLFSFLMFVFTLVETGEKGAAPIVTIPAG